jgi:hypothetical protein
MINRILHRIVSATAVLLASIFVLAGASAQQPQTRAEASGFTATSTQDDVLEFVSTLAEMSDRMKVVRLATSAQGRSIPMMIVGNPVPAGPDDVGDHRSVVYLQANIHGGEVEGKESLMMLVRDLLLADQPGYLDDLVLLVVPNFNPDGNERISTANRPSQSGPVAGVGVRTNGQNLDLNRDGIKLESPEVSGLVRILNEWDPLLFLDSHTHNGSYHQETVTWVWGLHPSGDAPIFDFMAQRMLPGINQIMTDRYATPVLPHGDFMDPRDPQSGWVPLGPEPRFLTNYVGLRNRFAILNEQYPYVDFESRVRDSYRFFQAVLDFMQVHHREMQQMATAADVRAASQPPSLATTWTAEPLAETIDIQGFEMDVQVAADGRLRVQPTEQLRTYESVPYFARYRPETQVALPGAYLLDASQRDAVAKLQQHGIIVDELTEAVELEIEVFQIQSIAPDPTLLQGHYLTRAGGEYQSATRLIEAGTFLVRLDQPLAMVVAAMLEPESSDSLLAWNVFSRAISMQLGNVQPEYPVYRLASPVEGLVTRSADPADGVHALLDELHRAAASGDSLRYLALFADNAVFMGTAPDEYFNLEQFSAYVSSRFEGGQGWSYLPSNRNIRLAKDGNTAWFEELVTSQANGIDFRGTGIVIREGKQWRVAQYNFSLPFSNEVWPDVIRLVQEN